LIFGERKRMKFKGVNKEKVEGKKKDEVRGM
jgi:hypothetical protein